MRMRHCAFAFAVVVASLAVMTSPVLAAPNEAWLIELGLGTSLRYEGSGNYYVSIGTAPGASDAVDSYDRGFSMPGQGISSSSTIGAQPLSVDLRAPLKPGERKTWNINVYWPWWYAQPGYADKGPQYVWCTIKTNGGYDLDGLLHFRLDCSGSPVEWVLDSSNDANQYRWQQTIGLQDWNVEPAPGPLLHWTATVEYVPEPSSVLAVLFGIGGLGAVLLRKRR